MTAKPERIQKLRAWVKVAALAGTVMGALWLWVLVVPFGYRPLSWAVLDVLVFPCVFLFFPLVASNIHDFTVTYLVLGATLNWLLYTQIIYQITRWRRQRRVSSGGAMIAPDAESSEVNYSDRWQKTKRSDEK